MLPCRAMLPRISIIVAMAENRVIGRQGGLPWHLPADLAHFKSLTMGRPMIMGRRTWESLPGLLPGRMHIIVTRCKDYKADGCIVVHSPEQALAVVGEASEAMVIGGAALYEEMLPQAHRIYLTLVHTKASGDVRFPSFDLSDWIELERCDHPPDDRHSHAFSFIVLKRRTASISELPASEMSVP